MRETETKTIGMESPSKEIHPHFGIDLKNLPEAKKWKLGEKYRVILELEMKGISEREEGEGYADFSVTGIEVLKSKKNYKVLYRD